MPPKSLSVKTAARDWHRVPRVSTAARINGIRSDARVEAAGALVRIRTDCSVYIGGDLLRRHLTKAMHRATRGVAAMTLPLVPGYPINEVGP
jgi:hypothetical protein